MGYNICSIYWYICNIYWYIHIYKISVAIRAQEAILVSGLFFGMPPKIAAANLIFRMNPMHRWWLHDGVAGPLNLDEMPCEICCEFLVCCYYEELFTGRARYACHYCSALALLGHNTLWSLHNLYWLPWVEQLVQHLSISALNVHKTRPPQWRRSAQECSVLLHEANGLTCECMNSH